MRLPNARDLNEEQERVYLYAPEDGRVLVSGPPGTGKTVLAVLRAMEAAKKGRRTAVAMFNRMLEAYACRLPDGIGSLEAQGIQVRTVRQLFKELWFGLRVPPAANAALILLDTSFDEREKVKELGAKWKPAIWAPWSPKSGKSRGYSWTVEPDEYWRNPGAFSRWSPTSDLPASEESEFAVDWDTVTRHLLKHQSVARWDALSIDKLIIDEGQDFPPEFFRLLRLMSEGVIGPEGRPLAVMVLADENQRLSAKQHSTISDIETALAIPASRHYHLRTNFRNTRQVALVAQHFFAGANTGIPLLPERRGPTPEMRRCESVQTAVEQIVTYQRNNPKHEIGVLIPDDDTARRAYFDALRTAAAPSSVRVQTYAFRDPEFNQPKRHLVFDEPAVTVLNRASCKGLEFDAVFVVNIHAARIEEGQEDFFKMGMYVMSARARRSLALLWVGRPSDRPQVLGLMPRAPAIRILA
ncbi:DEAD/DEAH box helicase [Teichococcus oryzae]|uniref:UvrD-like helicase ATP-binding domain-containing protein n=1 Tax=Teichococcus oryzae TaxID=1608942 RepID=A0A5B2TFC3_9PROT|nr:PhoH family protein [Pseudoroseomonas oryzae]KAA2213196.1 hypothetical protein F0Q34_11215 [Pseudoroseomonas oryzae]